jgi:hypothetical protein
MSSFKEIIEFIGKEKIFEWLSLLPKFYYRPRYFFRSLYSKSSGEKFGILIFYYLIIFTTLFFASHKDIDKIIKAIAIDSIVAIGVSFYFIINDKFINKLFKHKLLLEDIIYTVFFCRILFIPLYIVTSYLFVKTEFYEFYFASNSLISIGLILLSFGIPFFLYRKTKYILISILMNIIWFNTSIIIINKLRLDNKGRDINRLVGDEIYYEYIDKIYPIDSVCTNYPFNKLLVYLNDSMAFPVYTFRNITITQYVDSSNVFDTENSEYRKRVKETLSKFNFTRDSMKFERNKNLFDSLKAYTDLLLYDMKNPYQKGVTKVDNEWVKLVQPKFKAIINLDFDPKFWDAWGNYVKGRNNFIRLSNKCENIPMAVLACFSISCLFSYWRMKNNNMNYHTI